MIGVATGGSDVEQLRAAGAEAVLTALEAEAIARLIRIVVLNDAGKNGIP